MFSDNASVIGRFVVITEHLSLQINLEKWGVFNEHTPQN